MVSDLSDNRRLDEDYEQWERVKQSIVGVI